MSRGVISDDGTDGTIERPMRTSVAHEPLYKNDFVLIDLDDARRWAAGHGECRFLVALRLLLVARRAVGLRQARQRVAMHLAREIVVGRRGCAAVEADPYAQQRVGEAVFLLP